MVRFALALLILAGCVVSPRRSTAPSPAAEPGPLTPAVTPNHEEERATRRVRFFPGEGEVSVQVWVFDEWCTQRNECREVSVAGATVEIWTNGGLEASRVTDERGVVRLGDAELRRVGSLHVNGTRIRGADEALRQLVGRMRAELAGVGGTPELRGEVSTGEGAAPPLRIRVASRSCASEDCPWSPVAHVSVELQGASEAGATVSVSGRTDRQGVAEIPLQEVADGLLESVAPYTLVVDGARMVEPTGTARALERMRRRAHIARLFRQDERVVTVWDGGLAGLPVAGGQRRQIAAACRRANLRWQRRDDGAFECIGYDLPTPRHVADHRGAKIVYVFDGDTVREARLALPYAHTGLAERAGTNLAWEIMRLRGPWRDGGGGWASWVRTWHVQDVEGRSWDLSVGQNGVSLILQYRVRPDRPPSNHPLSPLDTPQ